MKLKKTNLIVKLASFGYGSLIDNSCSMVQGLIVSLLLFPLLCLAALLVVLGPLALLADKESISYMWGLATSVTWAILGSSFLFIVVLPDLLDKSSVIKKLMNAIKSKTCIKIEYED